MLDMIIGIGLFTAIIIALVVIILAAKSQLVASGSVSVVVNDERTVEAPVGSKLLVALADVNLFVASACGGKGTCGQCRVKIFEGGGTLLPSETSYVTKREAADFDRLSCQVTVKQPMRIAVPEEVFGVKQWECTVRSNDNVATFITVGLMSLGFMAFSGMKL